MCQRIKMKAIWLAICAAVAGAFAFLVAWWKQKTEAAAEQKAKEDLAEQLKEKVRKAKEEEAARKAVVAEEVKKVEDEVQKEKARDTVDAGNDLIAQLRAEQERGG